MKHEIMELHESGCPLILNINGHGVPVAWSGIRVQTSSRQTTNVVL